MSHGLLALSSLVLLGLAVGQALVLALQDYQLHHHKSIRWIGVLPPIQTMERVLFLLLAVSFVLLNILILNGVLFLPSFFVGHSWVALGLMIAAWILLVGLLCGRYYWGWRGQKVLKLTLAGAVLLLGVAIGHHVA